MNRDFAQRLRAPDLEGIPFKRRVAIVRARMENEAHGRRFRIVRGLTYAATLIAICASLVTLTMAAQDAHWAFAREQRGEAFRLKRAMWDIEDRVYRDDNARRYFISRVREYQGRLGHLAPRFLAQTPQHRLFRQPNLPQESGAFFEAFSGGAGTSGVCSTTAPTGAKGEVLTLTRASSATCTRTATGGLATTLIADGDLVTLSTNVARVEYDSVGTLGLLVEAARTNINLRSEEIDDAAWAAISSPSAATLNGACGTSPLAAPFSMPEDYTFAATSGAESSGRRGSNPTGCGSVACTYSYFVKGVGGSGTIDICGWGTTASCAACAYNDTTWTRCIVTATIAGTPSVFIGNSSANNGGVARSSNRVCVTGADAEAGAYATSYIPTTSAAVTRAAETATFAVTGTSQVISMAATGWPEWSTAVSSATLLATNGANASSLYQFGGCRFLTGGVNTIATWTAGSMRWAGWDNGASRNISCGANSATAATGAAASRWGTTLGIGDGTPAGIFQFDGIVSRVCVDPDPARCR